MRVPNAPCGVESLLPPAPNPFETATFLMHRVELKAHKGVRAIPAEPAVPNAPCGVERPL